MKTALVFCAWICATAFLFLPCYVRSQVPADTESSKREQRIDAILARMTLEEKVRLCFGGTEPGTSQIGGVPRLNLPPMIASDGPRGVTAAADTAFPSGLGLAMSWDPDLFQRVGAVMGKEARAAGISVVFAPALNIERDPLGGRFFEYLTEDPFLSGQLGVGMVRGIQEQKVASCVKHYAANNREENRDWYSSNVDDRALHEIYFPAFKAAVQQGEAWCVMTAANGINHELAATNGYLINRTLKRDWGFDGFVVTDYNQARDTLKAANAGLDVGMPWGDWESTPFGKPLMEAVQKGSVSQAVLDDKVRRVLRGMDRVGLLSGENPHANGEANTPASQATALRAAEESLVLLKNDRHVLPFNISSLRHVIVVGPNATRRQCIGLMGGSSGVQPPFEITPLDGIRQRLAGKTEVEYVELPEAGDFESIGEQHWKMIDQRRGVRGNYFNDGDAKPRLTQVEPVIDFNWQMSSPDPSKINIDNFHAEYSGDLVPETSGYYTLRLTAEGDARLVINGLPQIILSSSGKPASQTATVYLEAGKTYQAQVTYHALIGDASIHLEWARATSEAQLNRALQAVSSKLQAADAVIFVGGWDHGVDSEGQDRTNMDFPSSQEALITDVAALNPTTVVVLIHGSPFTMNWVSSVPAVLDAFYPGMEGGRAIAEALVGDVNPSGKLTFSWPQKLSDSPSRSIGTQDHENVNYTEGVFVGYRYYDTNRKDPEFPFGFGMSYSTFLFRHLRVKNNGDSIDTSLRLTNTSDRPGADVVQLYVASPNAPVRRPAHELRGFRRVELSAGETKTVEIHVDRKSLGYWNVKEHRSVFTPGKYRFEVGDSSRNLPISYQIMLRANPKTL
jgi:beta-glucosidase